jgi:hypothetical protein
MHLLYRVDANDYDVPMRWMIVLVLAGCGGAGHAELTCAMLADPNNCWAAAAAEATNCLAMHATTGVLSADRTTCTWSDGSTLTFDVPLPMTTMDLDHLSFTVNAPGCSWSFTDTFMNRMELTVGGEREVSQLHPDHTFELACHDGTMGSRSRQLASCSRSPQ